MDLMEVLQNLREHTVSSYIREVDAAITEAKNLQLQADNKFLLARSMNAGSCSFREDRDTGASSNSIIAIAFGLISINEQVLPSDTADLSACEKAFSKLPSHRKTKDAIEAIHRAEQALKEPK